MTDLRKAAEMALEVLSHSLGHSNEAQEQIDKTKQALRQAIAEAEEQKPVAWLQFKENEKPEVAPRDLGTPVYLGIRGGFAHDAQLNKENT